MFNKKFPKINLGFKIYFNNNKKIQLNLHKISFTIFKKNKMMLQLPKVKTIKIINGLDGFHKHKISKIKLIKK